MSDHDKQPQQEASIQPKKERSSNPFGYDGRISGNLSQTANGFTFAVPEDLRQRVESERQQIRASLISEE